MRAEAGVEDRVVLEDQDSRFNGVQRGAATGKNRPSGGERSTTTSIAGLDRLVGNVPSTAMHYERRFHREENGKAPGDCPERGRAAVFIL